MQLKKIDVLLWPKHFESLPDPRVSDGICFGDGKVDFVFLPTPDGRAFKISKDCSGYDTWVGAAYGTEFEVESI